jgi:hypothetical protein
MLLAAVGCAPMQAGQDHAGGSSAPASTQTTAAAGPAPTGSGSALNTKEYLNMTGSGMMGSGFDSLLKHSSKVAVAGFRVAFVNHNYASASKQASYFAGEHSSGVVVKMDVDLKGVDAQAMQAITDQAYKEFVAQLTAAGREVMPLEQLKNTAGFKDVDPTPSSPDKPHVREPGMTDGRGYLMFSPTGLPLWFEAGNPLGDKGPFSQGNNKAMNRIAAETKALVVFPMFVVDFAAMKSSGRSGQFSLQNKAEVSARPELSLRLADMPIVWAEDIRMGLPVGSDAGSAKLKKSLTQEGEFGAIEVVKQENNEGLVSSFASLGLSIGSVRSTSKNTLHADSAKYSELATKALQQGTGLLAQTFRENR